MASIGQYRFRGTGTCVSSVASEKSYLNTATVGAGETSTSFQDIQIITTQQLQTNRDYYLYVKIPQDMNYDMTFNIKLVRPETAGSDETVYQFLKSITVPRGGSGANVYNVALYGTGEYDDSGNEKVQAMIPLTYVANQQNTKGALYVDTSNNYYVGNGNNTYTPTTHVNDISMFASWIHKTGTNFGYAELVFRPVETSFSQIVIEMVRTAEDYNIQQEIGGQMVYGRRVNLDEFDYTLYSLTNIVDEINKDGSLNSIGVWGHSGLLMAVNGEEIRIGASGYYELLDIIPITSLGIVAIDYNDSFSVDYSYDKV